MNRRSFLRYPLAAATVGLAGCSAFGLGGDTDEVARVGERTAEDHLDVAVGNLNVAALSIATLESADDPRTIDFDEAEPLEHVEVAREALADAAADDGVGGDVEADLDAVETYATLVEGTVDAVAGVLGASDRLEAARDELDAEGDDIAVDDASAAIGDARTHSEGAVAARDDAFDARDRADGDRLAALDAVYEEVVDGLETLSGFVTGVDGMAAGYDDFLDGVDHLRAAEASATDDAFDAAAESFAAAQAAFEDADVRFGGTLPDAPDALTAELADGERRSGGFRLLSAGYGTLLEARTAVLSAEDELAEESYDAARESLDAGNAAADVADERFAEGQSVLDGEFADRFETARSRATAVEALTAGYGTLLDARDHIVAGEEHLSEAAYRAAAAAFDDAAETSRRADDAFAAASADGDDLFGDAFERARERAAGLEALSDGYAETVRAQRDVESGLDHVENRRFGAAGDDFAAANDTLAGAEATFEAGRTDAGDEFDAEFERALCRLDHLRTGVAHFEAAAEAGDEGDRSTAEQELERGEAALERAETC